MWEQKEARTKGRATLDIIIGIAELAVAAGIMYHVARNHSKFSTEQSAARIGAAAYCVTDMYARIANKHYVPEHPADKPMKKTAEALSYVPKMYTAFA